MTARILIVDDVPSNVRLLRARLLADYYETEVAADGFAALELARSWQPDIILLDIMMPGMDGFAVLQELLRRPELNGSQVVVVSAYEPFDRVEELARLNPQIAAAIRKPVSVDALGKSLQELARSFSVG